MADTTKHFKLDDEVVSIKDIAKKVEEELKLGSIGIVVNAFRSANKMDLLKEIIPHLSLGNREGIDDVLNGRIENRYY
jgi:hypothetical protein